jgi:hypothetical protein
MSFLRPTWLPTDQVGCTTTISPVTWRFSLDDLP